MSFEPEPDLDTVLLDLAGSGFNQVQIRFFFKAGYPDPIDSRIQLNPANRF